MSEKKGASCYLAIHIAGERHLSQTAAAHAAEALRSDRSSVVADRKCKVVVLLDHHGLLRTSGVTKVAKIFDSLVGVFSRFFNGLLVKPFTNQNPSWRPRGAESI
jgi:hypothetical protein